MEEDGRGGVGLKENIQENYLTDLLADISAEISFSSVDFRFCLSRYIRFAMFAKIRPFFVQVHLPFHRSNSGAQKEYGLSSTMTQAKYLSPRSVPVLQSRVPR